MRPSSAQPYLMAASLALVLLSALPDLLYLAGLVGVSGSIYAQEWRLALAALHAVATRTRSR